MNSHMLREGFASYYAVPRIEGHEYEERIIREQNCRIILPFEMRRVDDASYYYYKVSGLLSLKKRLTGNRMEEKDFLSVYQDILASVEELESFLLPSEGLILDSSVIFCDEQKGGLCFCYQPGRQCDLIEQLRMLTEDFLECMDYKNQKLVTMMYQIHDQLAKGIFPKLLLTGLAEERMDHQAEEVRSELVLTDQVQEVKPETVYTYEEDFYDEEEEEHGIKWKIEMAVSVALGVVFILILCYYLVTGIRFGWTSLQMKLLILAVLGAVADTIYLFRKSMEKPVRDIQTTIFSNGPSE